MLTGIITVAQPGVKAEAKSKLSKTKATICIGETLQLKLGGAKKIKWKSSKNSIASVDKDGVVTGKSKGNCVVTATSGGKNYTCKFTVKTLPKNYATINGKKVKVGKKVKFTYKLTAPTPVSDVSARYFFYENQMKIVTSADDKMRFKTWAFFNGFEEAMELQGDTLKEYKSMFKGMTKGKKPMMAFHQCCGVNAKRDNTQSVPMDCKKGKEFDSFYVKALAHGNFTFKADFAVWNNSKPSLKKYTMTETIK
ncbi:MAG: Ig-like domain-containing protein, partial [Lachnospiraceae bacterium]|nr:Ig-like domain-containing protein [Lachnospiraceae bacterium]